MSEKLKPKVLLIDGQVFQTAAWDRGMGKYSLALLEHMTSDGMNQYKESRLIFSDNIELTPEAEKTINDALPNTEKVYLPLQVPGDPATADIASMGAKNKKTLSEYVKYSNLDHFDHFIPSLFLDQVCCVFADDAEKKILIFYDLIPLQYIERYGALAAFPNYLKRFKTLFEANLLLAISQTVADDAVMNLGLSSEDVVNIDGAPIERAHRQSVRPSGIDASQRYLLAPTGNELRKNNLRTVRAFEKYRSESGDNIKLVLTSYFDEGTKNQLEKESSNLIFTGNVKEEELQWLFEHMQALLFLPEYEGLGLPILEAAETNKPIVCSNIGVFNEISLEAFFYCDHLDERSISAAIHRALGADETERTRIRKLYSTILPRYTWEKTATKAFEAIERCRIVSNLSDPKPKVAVLAPNPSGYSDIGKRMVQMHPSLCQYFEIDYYLEHGTSHHKLPRTEYLSSIAQVYGAELFDKNKYQQYDAVLYHLGNSEFHVETIKSALTLPGYAIVHDTHLANIFEGELLAYGYVSKARFSAEKRLDQLSNTQKTSFLTSISNRQLGLIAHSKYGKKAINELLLTRDISVLKADLPVPTPKQLPHRTMSKQKVIGFAGIIHPAKGLDIIESIAQSDEFADHRIHIFGLSLVTDDILRRLEAYPNVSLTTNVSDFEFINLLKGVDVLINYRRDYRGETSAATLEAMRFGVVPIVRKVGWYDELPDDVAFKAESETDVLKQLTHYFALNTDEQSKMAIAAHNFVHKNHSYQAYAKALSEFIISKNKEKNVNNRVRKSILENKSVADIKKNIEES